MGVQRQREHREVLRETGNKIQEEDLKTMSDQMQIFKDQLELFATKYKKDIQKNPEFRKHFQNMCSQCGVDPLASQKGFWSELLGVGDFYFELAVQVVEVCLAFQKSNGGIMDLDEVLKGVMKIRNKQAQIPCIDDCERAIAKLKILGKGFDIIKLDNKKLVQSVPTELNADHSTCLSLASGKGYIKSSELMLKNWTEHRVKGVLDFLVKEGFAWIDKQDGEEVCFWFPAFYTGQLL